MDGFDVALLAEVDLPPLLGSVDCSVSDRVVAKNAVRISIDCSAGDAAKGCGRLEGRLLQCEVERAADRRDPLNKERRKLSVVDRWREVQVKGTIRNGEDKGLIMSGIVTGSGNEIEIVGQGLALSQNREDSRLR